MHELPGSVGLLLGIPKPTTFTGIHIMRTSPASRATLIGSPTTILRVSRLAAQSFGAAITVVGPSC